MPHIMPMEKAKQRIAKFIDVCLESGCWNWTGCVQANGYARVTYKLKTMGAHRLSYMAFIGDIPPKMDVCHKCDNRKCVNPVHLFVGSRKDNMKDAVYKGRQAKGLVLPQTKLTAEDIRQIIEMANDGVLYKDIASKFGVTRSNISIIARKNGVRRNVK